MKCSKILLLGALVLPRAVAEDNEMAMADGHAGHDGHSGASMDSNLPDMAADDMGMSMDDGSEMEASPMSMEHHHGRPILEDPHLEPQQRKYWEAYNTTTYFSAPEGNKFTLWMHAILSVAAFAFLGPITLLCSTDSRAQWFYIPLQTAQSSIAVAALLCLALYSATAPDLYPGNAYSGFSGAMFVLIIVHWLAMITKAITSYLNLNEYSSSDATGEFRDRPVAREADDEGVNAYVLDDLDESQRESSLTASEYGSASETDVSSFDAEHDAVPKHLLNNGCQGGNYKSSQSAPIPPLVRKLAENKFFARINAVVGKFSTFVFNVLNYPLFFTSCGYLLTGLATAFLMGKDKKVFALLAHFIKGFVFYALGFVELARFFGVGASRGWAWNEVRAVVRKDPGSKGFFSRALRAMWPAHPTFEFVQSFLIFFYGATNVFLEHLGNTDGVWSHKDLQHASIAFMFFGGGLCGMILESNHVKGLISQAFNLGRVTGAANNNGANTNFNEVRIGWSFNPMPAFIVFWTGALMSHHQQETELSTQIHVQWGTMLSLAAVIRLITIALLYTKPRPLSKEEASFPQRPFTEVLVAFCLVCGGIIFMASNRETVEGMIYRGMDQMFILNVTVGFTVLMMSYFICCLALKGWASSRYTNRTVPLADQ